MLDKLVSKWKKTIAAEVETPGCLVQCWECGHVHKAAYADSPCSECGGLVEVLYEVDAQGEKTFFKQGKSPCRTKD